MRRLAVGATLPLQGKAVFLVGLLAVFGGLLGASAAYGATRQPALAASLVAAGGAIALAVVSPITAVVILLLSGRYEVGPLVSGYHDLAFWTAIGLVMAAPARAMTRGKASRWLNLPAVALAAFAVIVFAAQFSGLSGDYGREKAIRTLFYATIFIVATASYVTRPNFERFLLSFVLFVDALGAVSLVLTLRTTSLFEIQRISPPGGGPITLARYLGLAVIACMGLALIRRKHRSVFIGNAVALALLCFLTGSRGPAVFLVITLLAALAMTLVSQRTRGLFTRIAAVALIGLLVGLPSWQYAQSTDAPFARRFDLLVRNDPGQSVLVRESNYRLALELARRSPFTGAGTGSWPELVDDVNPRSYPHNVFLEILVEQGAAGLVSFSVFVVAVLALGLVGVRHARNQRDATILLVAVASFVYALMIAQTSGDLYDNRLVWFYGALVGALAVGVSRAARDATPLSPTVAAGALLGGSSEGART